MALPKEPRQKMINIMYLVLTAILALNVSAEIIQAFKTVDASLTTSSSNLTKSNDVLYASLQAKLKDPQTAEKAARWVPKADLAKKYSGELIAYIDDLKLQLKKGSGLVIKEDGTEDFKLDNLDAATRIFEKQGEGDKFKQLLDQYKENMLKIDSSIDKEFRSSFPVNTDPVIGQEKKKKDFTQAYFHMTPSIAAITMLSKFQNNIKNAENLIVTYCHNKIGSVELTYNKFQAIATANSNYLMPGQELIITAGVGAFNDQAKPSVSIGGSPISLNENGVAEKKFNVSGSGQQRVKVRISFKDQENKEQVVEKDVEYTVGQPGVAAVMLDKMNVFYIGVDNPVTIGSPTGFDRTQVTMSNGTITGSGPSRTVRVTTVGEASINVTADKKTYTYPFRVKKIPEPIFKVGRGGTRMPTVEFKNQRYCRAELENFPFDLKFNVVSATVYFSGAGFSSVKKEDINSNDLGKLDALMKQCQPGSNITFDNVKVQGPDGVRTIQGVGIILY